MTTPETVEGFRLSPQQQYLWRVAGEDGAFRSQALLDVVGAVDPASLAAAVRRVAERHEILRTGFRSLPGMAVPLQIIASSPSIRLHYGDLGALSRQRQDAEIEAQLGRLSQARLDLERPSLQLALLTRSPRRHALLIASAALCLDGHSLERLACRIFEELKDAARSEEPLQYADLAEWQNELLEGADSEAGRAFWRGRDYPVLADVRLPRERGGHGRAPFRPRRIAVEVSPATSARIASICERHGASETAFFCACWQVLLWRLTGRGELAVGVSHDGRRHPDLRDALGLFAKVLPVAGELGFGLPFPRLLEKLHRSLTRAARWQDFYDPGSWGNAVSRLPFGLELVDSSLALSSNGLEFRLRELRSCIDRYRAKISVIRRRETTTLELRYDGSAFDRSDAELLCRRFVRLVESVLENPSAPIDRLRVVPEEELHRLLVDFNADRSRDLPHGLFHRLFEAQCRRWPRACAATGLGETLSYRELNRRANRLAHCLRGLGIGPDVLVAVCLPRKPGMAVAILAVLKAGGAYLPLDPALPADRLAFMLEDCAAPVLVTRHELAARLPAHRAHPVYLDRDGESISWQSAANPLGGATESNLAYAMYTSGTSGRPKAVAIEHRQLVSYVSAISERLGLRSGASFALVSTFATDLGNTVIFPALASGGSLHVLGPEQASDAAALARYCDLHPIDCLKIVPGHLRALLDHPDAGRLLPRQQLVLGGEALPPELVERLKRLAPDCRIFNHYGPTEATVGALVWEVAGVADRETATVPIGRPLSDRQAYLLDRWMEPVPAGVPGELYLGGEGLARGYLGRPSLTAARFLPDPFAATSGARLYRTGDLAGHLGDAIEFLGRVDGQVKIRGYRVEVGEVEAVLREHPGVGAAAVTARPDSRGHLQLIAYLVARGSPVTAGELREHVARQLPSYMLPHDFVLLDSLPLTASGKLDREALPAPVAKPGAKTPRAPRTPAEKILARIWREVLGLDVVGVDDDFFALGGDSILGIRIAARAHEHGLELSPMLLFEHSTLAELAKAAAPAGAVRGAPGPAAGPVPLVPAQRWLLEQELADLHHWNMAVLLDLRERVLAAELEAAFEILIAHHDALRLRFHPDERGYRQEIVEPALGKAAIVATDLTALPPERRDEALGRGIEALQRGLDLSRGPLLIAALFDVGDDTQKLLIIVHHLVMDAVSWPILLEGLERVVHRLRRGEAADPGARTTSFARWSRQLTDFARRPELREELDFWLDQLRSPVPPLPRDRPAGPNTVAEARTVTDALDAGETRALSLAAARIGSRSIEEMLLAAVLRAFWRWTGERALLIEVERHGREPWTEDLNLARTVGWFTSRFPLRLRLDGSTDRTATLASVAERLRSAPHKGLGYGLLRYLVENRDLSRQLESLPEPEVTLNYLGRVGDLGEDASLWLSAAEVRESSRSAAAQRRHAIAVEGRIAEGRLRLDWTFSEALYHRSTLERLARDCTAELRELIAETAAKVSSEAAPLPVGQTREPSADLDDVEDLYPLSPVQHGMLFHCLEASGASLYVIQTWIDLDGPLDPAAWERAWQTVVRRHPTLRTRFLWEGLEVPLQAVHSRVELPSRQLDFSHLAPDEKQARWAALRSADRRRGFDLATAPLARLTTVRYASGRHRLLWSYHHLVTDGWSNALLLREVLEAYDAFLHDREPDLPAPRPYRDFLVWLEARDRRREEAFWRAELPGLPPPLALEADLRGAVDLPGEEPFGSEEVVLEEPEAEALRAVARRHRLTLNTVFQGLWALTLHHHTGAEELLLGIAVSGRPPSLAGVESMVGLFINALPLRFEISRDAPLLEWLERSQERLSALRRFEHTALVDVASWIGAPPGRPLFESVLSFENYPIDESLRDASDGLRIQAVRTRVANNYPLNLFVEPGRQILVELAYDRRRLRSITSQRLLQDLEALLRQFVESPTTTLEELAPGGNEGQELLDGFTEALDHG